MSERKHWPSPNITLRGQQRINAVLAPLGLCLFIEPIRLCCWNEVKKQWMPLKQGRASAQFRKLQEEFAEKGEW